MKITHRLTSALKVAYAAFKSPEVVSSDNLASLVSLYELIFKVIENRRPQLAHIGFLNADSGEKTDIATLWCGYGANSSPSNRITELCGEVEALSHQNALLTEKAATLEAVLAHQSEALASRTEDAKDEAIYGSAMKKLFRETSRRLESAQNEISGLKNMLNSASARVALQREVIKRTRNILQKTADRIEALDNYWFLLDELAEIKAILDEEEAAPRES